MKRKEINLNIIFRLIILAIFSLSFFKNNYAQQDDCTAKAKFNIPAENIYMGTTLQFENVSTGAALYEWIIYGEVVSQQNQCSHYFNASGNLL